MSITQFFPSMPTNHIRIHDEFHARENETNNEQDIFNVANGVSDNMYMSNVPNVRHVETNQRMMEHSAPNQPITWRDGPDDPQWSSSQFETNRYCFKKEQIEFKKDEKECIDETNRRKFKNRPSSFPGTVLSQSLFDGNNQLPWEIQEKQGERPERLQTMYKGFQNECNKGTVHVHSPHSYDSIMSKKDREHGTSGISINNSNQKDAYNYMDYYRYSNDRNRCDCPGDQRDYSDGSDVNMEPYPPCKKHKITPGEQYAQHTQYTQHNDFPNGTPKSQSLSHYLDAWYSPHGPSSLGSNQLQQYHQQQESLHLRSTPPMDGDKSVNVTSDHRILQVDNVTMHNNRWMASSAPETDNNIYRAWEEKQQQHSEQHQNYSPPIQRTNGGFELWQDVLSSHNSHPTESGSGWSNNNRPRSNSNPNIANIKIFENSNNSQCGTNINTNINGQCFNLYPTNNNSNNNTQCPNAFNAATSTSARYVPSSGQTLQYPPFSNSGHVGSQLNNGSDGSYSTNNVKNRQWWMEEIENEEGVGNTRRHGLCGRPSNRRKKPETRRQFLEFVLKSCIIEKPKLDVPSTYQLAVPFRRIQ
eukprot:Ihof_evm4s326 gene=Ihof_evmTU4s326